MFDSERRIQKLSVRACFFKNFLATRLPGCHTFSTSGVWEHSRIFKYTCDKPLMEDNIWWKTTFNGRCLSMEDNFWWKMTLNGRRPSMEYTLLWKTTFGGRKQSFWTRGFLNWILTLKTKSCICFWIEAVLIVELDCHIHDSCLWQDLLSRKEHDSCLRCSKNVKDRCVR